MPTQYIITGTDTGVGKTVFAAALAQALKAHYWKPVQSGVEEQTDSEIVAQLCNGQDITIIPEIYRLQTPVSPHFSAELDNVVIEPDKLVTLPTTTQPLIIEGAGGVFVPLTNDYLQIDLFAAWKMPVIICARTTLGTINHTMLTITALRARQIPIHGIVFIGDENINTQETIIKLNGINCLGRLPWLQDLSATTLQQAFKTFFSLSSFQSPVWHPFRQHAIEPSIQCVERTEGAYLITKEGNRVLDAISSWWVITHKHRHPTIMNAIKQAADQMDQVIFADYTHAAAESLGNELIKLAPPGLSHVFYADSGSTSVEIAIKLALGYFHHREKPRRCIVVMEHSYHGDTIGSMSISERGVFTAAYQDLLFDVEMLPFPHPGQESKTLEHFQKICANHNIAALIIEPLVLGVAGFKMYPPSVLTELKRIAEQYEVLLIADEVMTGWGRTGTLFACEQATMTPDILCTAKGLTGGSLPLAATLCTSDIFAAHYSTDRRKTFYHSSSYTANPLACAAALANIQVWQQEPVLDRIQQIGKWHLAEQEKLQSDSRFINFRHIGMLAAFDINVGENHYLAEQGFLLRNRFKQRNILLRPLGNTIYIMLPYCVTQKEVEYTYQVIEETVSEVLCH